MDNPVNQYRQIIEDVLEDYMQTPAVVVPGEEIEEQLIMDTLRGHYQVLTIGWENGRRVYYPVFHIDIKGEKVWIQEDATDFDLVGELERRGIPKTNIALAFQAPYKRPFTGYASA